MIPMLNTVRDWPLENLRIVREYSSIAPNIAIYPWTVPLVVGVVLPYSTVSYPFHWL